MNKQLKMVAGGMAGLAAGLGAMSMSGCRTMQPLTEPNITIPAQDVTKEIRKQQQDLERRIKENMENVDREVRATCGHDPSNPPSACEMQVRGEQARERQQMRELIRNLDRLIELINQENWQQAEEYRKQLLEKYKDLVLKYPDMLDLLKLFEEWLKRKLLGIMVQGKPTTVPAQQQQQTTTLDGLPKSAAFRGNTALRGPGATSTRYDLGGSATLAGLPISISGYATASGTGNSRAITDARFNVTLPNGRTAVATLRAQRGFNTLSVDRTGKGVASLALAIDKAEFTGDAIDYMIGSNPTIRIPVTIAGDGTLTVSGDGEQLFPHRAWPASDFNRDGKLDESSDAEAFLSAFSMEIGTADVNIDGKFDDRDISQWFENFHEDVKATR